MKVLLVVGFIVVVAGAPSSKVMTTYDQKQTGDYNIQLHLKDFQIVALIGDDTLGAFGDYEYNYDYSDLTIKPHNSSTTAKPVELSSSTTVTTTELPAKSSSTPVPSTTTQKLPETSSLSEAPPANSSKTVRSDNSVIAVAPSSTTEKTQKVTSVTIVPQENNNNNSSVSNILNLGEILHYRKCPAGYSKDKRGRCRRTRRPGVIPYGITRFASNLAAKFRHAVSDEDDAEEETSEE